MLVQCLIFIIIIRSGHSSWDSPAGVILMGGQYYSATKTTEKIQQDGTSSYSFDLKYDTR